MARHTVAALLSAGWIEQECDDARDASALFDRLRQAAPFLPIQRCVDDRPVEINTGAGGAPIH